MFRLPVFGILLTAVLLSLPGPAGASFAVTEYAPVLSRLYKDKQSPLASSYRISFDKSKSSAPCLTAYTLTGTAAELIRYDCTRLPADNIFSRSRSENDGSLKELAAVFNGLRHNNDDKPGIALVNDGTIDKIYADFINNASGTAFGQSIFYNRGFVKELNGDFVGSRLNNHNPERPLAAGAAVVNAAAGSISLVNVNVTDNRLNNPGGTENSIWLNAGSVSRMNAVFAGNRVRGDFGSSAVLLNTGSLTSVKGIFSANSVNGEKAAAGGAVLNEGRIDLIEADFVDNRLQTASADTGGAAVRIPRQGKLFTIRNANFIANTAASDSGRVLGGALSVSCTVDGLITNPVFIGNGARGRSADSAFGGAVYTEKPLTFSIDGKQNAVFSGNYTDNAGISDPNAFYIDKTSVVFSVRGNGIYIFDDNIRGRQPLVFASSGSFAANRESFKVKKVYGSPYMFDILYKEEDGGLKKSWSLVMNDTPNPDYRPAADTPAESSPDPETLKDTSPEERKAETSPAAEKSVSQTMPDCRGNPGCLFFKALNRATSVIYLIIAGTHKITDTTLTAIENALCGFMVRLNKAVSFFAPEAEPAGETPAGPKAAKTTESSV